MIGDGISRGELDRAIAEHGLGERVDVRGALPRAEVLQWLRAADAAILPSDWENFPHAAVEALAAGTPVIATAVGGVPEIVETGVNGILVAPGRRRGARARQWHRSPSTRRCWRACAKEREASAEQYGQEAVFGAIEAQLELAAAGS